MTVGAPAAEAKFREAIEDAKKECPNVEEYPVIYVSSLAILFISCLNRHLRLSTVRHSRTGTQ